MRTTQYIDPVVAAHYADDNESPTEGIIFNLTPSQWAQATREATEAGYKSVHAYARDLFLRLHIDRNTSA